ncbi:MAG: murein DD-endopeptidase MepM/ murein hydrolase activator NlpD [Flavobacteriales bacterium]|jgi:murein DD-endopeptidase MepM/ murein hydrolase activator NlpD
MQVSQVIQTLRFSPVVPFKLEGPKTCILSFENFISDKNLSEQAYTASIKSYVEAKLQEVNAKYAIGGYLENRQNLYSRSSHFDLEDDLSRSVHLGTDIWCPAGTPIYAPLEGTIHSFKNNNSYGNYGPTIILEHTVQEVTFFTLYGHLSLESLIGIKAGQKIISGQQIATLGQVAENVGWPPHLHFQLITDMQNMNGDYPGVASTLDIDKWKGYCLDPNLILRSQI